MSGPSTPPLSEVCAAEVRGYGHSRYPLGEPPAPWEVEIHLPQDLEDDRCQAIAIVDKSGALRVYSMLALGGYGWLTIARPHPSGDGSIELANVSPDASNPIIAMIGRILNQGRPV